ncbi:MAG: plasmid stabilization protein [Patescibacteria group bacterium]
MPVKPLRLSLQDYLKKHQLVRKFEKQVEIFEQNPRHRSLNTELLEPKSAGIYSFRIDRKYRAIFIIVDSQAEVIDINSHYQ